MDNKVNSADFSLEYYATPNPVKAERRFFGNKRSVKIQKISDESYLTKQLFHAVQHGSLYVLESIPLKAWKERLNILDDKNNYSLLHYAAQENHKEVLCFLLELKPDINIPGSKKIHPIHLAAQMGHAEIVEILCNKKNIQIDATDIKGQTALHLACKRGHQAVVKTLLKYKANVYKLEVDLMSVMHNTARRNDIPLIQILISNGAPLNTRNSNGTTPLMIIAIEGHTELFKLYIQEIQLAGFHKRMVLDEKDNDGLSCLAHAVQNMNTEIIMICVQNGADLYTRQNDGKTIFHTAAVMGYLDIFRDFDSKLIDFSIIDDSLNTPLHYAILNNNIDMVKLIMKLKAPINMCNRSFLTPTMLACKELSEGNNTTEIIKFLIESNADIMIRDGEMKTILHYLVEKQNLVMISYVINKIDPSLRKIFVNLQDIYRDSPLHCAARFGNAKISKCLLDAGSDPLALSNDDFLPLHIATKEGHMSCVLLFLEASKGISNYRDSNENAAIHLAAEAGHFEIFQYLVNVGKDKFSKDEFGRNTLMFASRSGCLEIVRLLLQWEININLYDQIKNTALHEASSHGHLHVVKCLWDFGAVLTENIFGQSPLDIALFNNQWKVARFFLNDSNWKISMNFRHKNGTTHIKSLIKYNSEITMELMDKCITENTTNKMDPKYEIRYWFGVLDPGPEDPASINKRYFALTSMSNRKKIELLKHPLSKRFLDLKWRRFGLGFFLVDLLLYLLYLACFTAYMTINTPVSGNATTDATSGCEKNSSNINTTVSRSSASNGVIFLNSLIYSAVIVRLLLQLVKLISQRQRYFLEFWNYLFLLCHILIFFFIKNPANLPCLFEWQYGAIVAFLSWFLLVYYLQYFPVIGLEVVMFQKVTFTAMKVIVIFFCIFVGFAYGFYIVNNNQDPFNSFQISLLKTFGMLIGELDLVTYFVKNVGNYNIVANILVAFFIIIMCIAFLNLLVGLAVGDIDKISSEAVLEGIKLKVKYVWEVESKLPLRLQRSLNSTEVLEKPTHNYQSNISKMSRVFFKEEASEKSFDDHLKAIDLKLDSFQMKMEKN